MNIKERYFSDKENKGLSNRAFHFTMSFSPQFILSIPIQTTMKTSHIKSPFHALLGNNRVLKLPGVKLYTQVSLPPYTFC